MSMIEEAGVHPEYHTQLGVATNQGDQNSMSVADIFHSMPGRFQADRAADTNMNILFDLSGDEGGQWNVDIANGQLNVSEGAPAATPGATVKMTAEDFQAMSSGALNPMMAFMTGKIKVDGDLNSVMKFQSLVGF
jgi:putative sterol carrier protein